MSIAGSSKRNVYTGCPDMMIATKIVDRVPYYQWK